MMRLFNSLFRYCFVLLIIVLVNQIAYSQEDSNQEKNFDLYSSGLSIGWYNPEMDYWKNESEFKDADFKGAIDVNAFLNLTIIQNLHGQAGLGYWQESVKYDLQGFGNTTLLLTGIPVSLDFQYRIVPLQFSVVTPFIGTGGEFLFVQHKMKFDLNDDPAPQSGSTIMGHAIVGFETKLSEQFAVDIDFQYKFGSYNQDFKIENPNNPEENEIITETISLNGPRVGITLKYLL